MLSHCVQGYRYPPPLWSRCQPVPGPGALPHSPALCVVCTLRGYHLADQLLHGVAGWVCMSPLSSHSFQFWSIFVCSCTCATTSTHTPNTYTSNNTYTWSHTHNHIRTCTHAHRNTQGQTSMHDCSTYTPANDRYTSTHAHDWN